jgi:Ergosterol biosynthesis ERG4/ERG24 family
MITHRAVRDIQRCRAKYGEAWREYERRVPWLFVPVSFALFLDLFFFWFLGEGRSGCWNGERERERC